MNNTGGETINSVEPPTTAETRWANGQHTDDVIKHTPNDATDPPLTGDKRWIDSSYYDDRRRAADIAKDSAPAVAKRWIDSGYYGDRRRTADVRKRSAPEVTKRWIDSGYYGDRRRSAASSVESCVTTTCKRFTTVELARCVMLCAESVKGGSGRATRMVGEAVIDVRKRRWIDQTQYGNRKEGEREEEKEERELMGEEINAIDGDTVDDSDDAMRSRGLDVESIAKDLHMRWLDPLQYQTKQIRKPAGNGKRSVNLALRDGRCAFCFSQHISNNQVGDMDIFEKNILDDYSDDDVIRAMSCIIQCISSVDKNGLGMEKDHLFG